MARISVDRIHGGLYTGRRIESKPMRKLGECPETEALNEERADKEAPVQPIQKKVRKIIHRTFDITTGPTPIYPEGFFL